MPPPTRQTVAPAPVLVFPNTPPPLHQAHTTFRPLFTASFSIDFRGLLWPRPSWRGFGGGIWVDCCTWEPFEFVAAASTLLCALQLPRGQRGWPEKVKRKYVCMYLPLESLSALRFASFPFLAFPRSASYSLPPLQTYFFRTFPRSANSDLEPFCMKTSSLTGLFCL